MTETDPLRILHLITSLNSAGGGVAEGLRSLTACAAEVGIGQTVVSLDAPDAPWLDLGHARAIGLGPARLGTFSYAPQMLPWLRAHAAGFDAAVVHGLWQYPGVAARLALRSSGVPYFVYPHGMLGPWFKHHHPLKHLKKSLYWRIAQHAVLADAAAALFTCEEERRLARDSFKPYRLREAVVSFGTTIPVDSASGDSSVFLDAFPMLRGRRLVLFLGRLHPIKGCDLLLEGFAQVAQQTDLHLVMAGPDPVGWQQRLQRSAARLGIGDRVTWTGMLPASLKWSALRAADCVALPSHHENFGMTVAESLAVGTPVLISDKVNIWREIDADGAGLVAPDTRDGTASLLQRWLALAPDARRQMAERARDCFAQRFEMRRAVENLLRVISAERPA